MSPYPIDPAEARGPMRLVMTTYPDLEVAQEQIERVVGARLAACAQMVPIRAWYWWKGRVETGEECLVIFKTAPKRVGALFYALERGHPYEVPEVIELDVPRVAPGYLSYLTQELMPGPQPPLGQGELTRPAAPRARGVRCPGRTPAPRRRRSR